MCCMRTGGPCKAVEVHIVWPQAAGIRHDAVGFGVLPGEF